MKKNILSATLASLCLLSIGCTSKDKAVNQSNTSSQETERVEQVMTSVLRPSEIAREIEVSTTLQGYETLNVAPSLTGRIERIYVEVGDKVRKGDDLLCMDQNQYKTTKLAFTNLETEMKRMEALRQSGSIAQQTYDQTKLSYNQTKENLEFIEANTYFKAPFQGVISAKNYEEGELYSGQPILVLTQINTLKALINIPESYFPLVKPGMKIQLSSGIYQDEAFPAVIELIYPTIDAATHTFTAKIKIPNKSERLRPGMYVKTTIALGRERIITAPYQAVMKLTGSNERYVFINEDGRAKRVTVQIGQRFDDMLEIISHEISEGMEIVSVGQDKLVDGVKLNVVRK